MSRHVCRRGGRPARAMEGAAWAMPGEIVKLVDEDRWGRVEMMYRCCHVYDVRVEATEDQEGGIFTLPPDGLENAYEAYPANMPPKGYPVPSGHHRSIDAHHSSRRA